MGDRRVEMECCKRPRPGEDDAEAARWHRIEFIPTDDPVTGLSLSFSLPFLSLSFSLSVSHALAPVLLCIVHGSEGGGCRESERERERERESE